MEGFIKLLYADGTPVGNTNMADAGWWIVDGMRSIFKSGESGEMYDAVWVGKEEVTVRLYEDGQDDDGDVWRIYFKPYKTYLDIQVAPAAMEYVNDGKGNCLHAGKVSGSGHSRNPATTPVPIVLCMQLNLLELADLHKHMTLRTREMLALTDCLAKTLENRAALLKNRGQVEAELDELKVAHNRSMSAEQVRELLNEAVTLQRQGQPVTNDELRAAVADATITAAKVRRRIVVA